MGKKVSPIDLSLNRFMRKKSTVILHVDQLRNYIVRPSGRGTVHSRPHKIFLHFHDLSTLLNKIREGVAL